MKRFFFLALLMVGGVVLIAWIALTDAGRNLPPTAAPLFELLGKPLKTADVVLTRAVLIDDVDEKKLGDAIALRYESYRDEEDPDWKYLQDLVSHLSRNRRKGFEYRVFLLPDHFPNAAAAPGGVLFVTRGLLDLVESESELVAVLGHEIGHVELSHCMDMVRFELLARKMGATPLGELADMAVGIILRPSFSKTQEADADAYGFRMLLAEGYNPFGMANSFQKLADLEADPSRSPIEEYFMSHPYSHLRAEKYRSEAKQAEIKDYYIGQMNLEQRKSRYEEEFPKEWSNRTDP
ncbi:MAG: M48 family metallopeptidase [Leptospiraceae bacterium]|nr:M48 family metallopeptidase [Leptospiraceae bacterium]